MANIVFNIALGKIAELAGRVNANDPTNSVFQVSLWNTSAADSVIRDLDTVADVESNGSTAELTSGTNANYARKTLDQAGGIVVTVNDTSDRIEVDTGDHTWTALGAGTNPTDLMFQYDSDSTAGTDANQVPLTFHDFAVTPDGSDLTATVADFFRATSVN